MLQSAVCFAGRLRGFHHLHPVCARLVLALIHGLRAVAERAGIFRGSRFAAVCGVLLALHEGRLSACVLVRAALGEVARSIVGMSLVCHVCIVWYGTDKIYTPIKHFIVRISDSLCRECIRHVYSLQILVMLEKIPHLFHV